VIPKPWQQLFAKRREERVRNRLVRKMRPMRHMGSTRVQLGSREYVNFSSNDYLGLAGDLRIAEAAAAAAGRFGWGTGASRLVTGTSTLHQKLEQEVARFRGAEAALLFGSGYQANLGVLSALLDKGDIVLSDESNHASIIAGCKLAGATVRVFKHRDYEDLERKLAGGSGRKMVITDTLFSIEGDTADLPRIVKLCDRHGALLVIDDAHANACLGKKGRGLAEYQSVLQHVPVVIGTFSKALGSYGGFVCCSEEMREFFVNESRPFIYTTSMPIALTAANIEALRIVHKDGEALRLRLSQHVKALRSRLEGLGFTLTGYHHIIGIRIGDPERVCFMAEEIEKQGLLAYPMRFPSVAQGQDTLRISVSAAHNEDDLSRLATALRVARDRMGGKETTILVKREAKRPTHQNLGVADSDDLDESAFANDETGMGEPMTAIDSNRLPPADHALGDFAPMGGGSGDTMISEPGEKPLSSASAPELQISSSGRLPVVDSSESGGFEALLEDVMQDIGDSSGSQPAPVVVSEAELPPTKAPELEEAAPPAHEPKAEEAGQATPDAAQEAVTEDPKPDTDPAPSPTVPEPAKVETPTAAEAASEAKHEAGQEASSEADRKPSEEKPQGESPPEENPPEQAPEDSKSGDTLPADSSATIIPDGPMPGPGSGDTLAPEHSELPDPVIAEIEGGTRRRKREKTRRRTRNHTRSVKKS